MIKSLKKTTLLIGLFFASNILLAQPQKGLITFSGFAGI
jgi:hypothetical protein